MENRSSGQGKWRRRWTGMGVRQWVRAGMRNLGMSNEALLFCPVHVHHPWTAYRLLPGETHQKGEVGRSGIPPHGPCP